MPGPASDSWREAADSLSIFQTGRVDIQREGQRGRETRASNVCGLNVAVPSGARYLAAAGWYLWVTGQTSAERAQDGQHGRWSPGCVTRSGMNTEDTGVKSPSVQTHKQLYACSINIHFPNMNF